MFKYLAQLPTPTPLVNYERDFAPAAKFKSLGDLIKLVGTIGSLIGGLFVVLALVYAAYKYMTSNGEEKALGEAKQALTYGLIGLVVVLTAFWIMQLLARFTGVKV